MDATPAKWKVLSVICVPGSPMDCAPTAPTVEPGSIFALTYFVQQISMNSRNCPSVTFTRLSTAALSASVYGQLMPLTLMMVMPRTRSPHCQVSVCIPLVLSLQRIEHMMPLADVRHALSNVLGDELTDRRQIRSRALGSEFASCQCTIHELQDLERQQATARSRRNGLHVEDQYLCLLRNRTRGRTRACLQARS